MGTSPGWLFDALVQFLSRRAQRPAPYRIMITDGHWHDAACVDLQLEADVLSQVDRHGMHALEASFERMQAQRR
jgi:hypothetical protein